ncbi:MAG: hypothetical protein JXP34_16840, partial [Planctomycetes bacterium]|nr:hypothetical protein [Planctomycetota bacterium]
MTQNRLHARIGVIPLAFLLPAVLSAGTPPAARPPRTVDVKPKPDAPWTAHPTRILEDLPAEARLAKDSALSPYGGLRARKTKATGFFHPARIEGRWWLVDPEGCLFLHKGVCSVNMLRTPGARAALKEIFGD